MPSKSPLSTPSQPKRRARNLHFPSIPRGTKRVIRDAWWVEVKYHWTPPPKLESLWETVYGDVFPLETALKKLANLESGRQVECDFRLRHADTNEIIWGAIVV